VRTLPAAWYHEPAVFEQERRAIFAREWLYVGRAGQLRRRGDYVAVDVCGWPVVVVALDDAGGLAAFHNVCRHRAGPLVWDGDGNCGSSFVCRYHGWSYGLDGALRNARDFGADPAGIELATIRVETWRGLVFVNLDTGAPPLLDDLGPFAALCEPFPMETFTAGRDVAETVDANWKTYADNYLEGYHLPLVHPGLLRHVDAKRYRVEVGDKFVLHVAPPRHGAATAGRWLWRWPNLAINVYPDGMNIERFWPLGPHRTQIAYTYLFAAGTDAAAQEASMKLSLELLDEDRRICEAVQRNLASGTYDTGELSPRHEDGVAYFQSLVLHATGSPPTTTGN
jgi:choline monooxygenase